MFRSVNQLDDFMEIVADSPAVLAYFSTTDCNVCKVLKPKVEEMVTNEFTEIRLLFIETNHAPELAAQNRIFAVPTLVVYFAGRESIRKSRSFGLEELRAEIRRPYDLMFG
jgi:thioredoxin-like negative regulator of GroEL